jgi:hypothetical protein
MHRSTTVPVSGEPSPGASAASAATSRKSTSTPVRRACPSPSRPSPSRSRRTGPPLVVDEEIDDNGDSIPSSRSSSWWSLEDNSPVHVLISPREGIPVDPRASAPTNELKTDPSGKPRTKKNKAKKDKKEREATSPTKSKRKAKKEEKKKDDKKKLKKHLKRRSRSSKSGEKGDEMKGKKNVSQHSMAASSFAPSYGSLSLGGAASLSSDDSFHNSPSVLPAALRSPSGKGHESPAVSTTKSPRRSILKRDNTLSENQRMSSASGNCGGGYELPLSSPTGSDALPHCIHHFRKHGPNR